MNPFAGGPYRDAIALSDVVQAEFSCTSTALGQTGGSPLGPQTGLLGLWLECCPHSSGTMSSAWLQSEMGLESRLLPGVWEGVARLTAHAGERRSGSRPFSDVEGVTEDVPS